MTGAEICRNFKLKTAAVSAEETDRLQSLYFQWERRILWPINTAENLRHERECAEFVGKGPMEIKPMKDGLKWCKCRTRQQEVHEWEDWALSNMDKSLEELSWE